MANELAEGSLRSRRTVVSAAVLFALTCLVYAGVLRNDFVNYDDTVYVTENPHVLAGLTWEGFVWAFTSFEASNWHPLTWLSHMTDCQVFGLDPAGHHAVSVLLHAANAVLLFALLLYMTRAQWPSLVVAALFALHPLRVQSVAWVAERKDVLSGFFWMTTLFAYAWYARRPGRRRLALVGVSFALGLMAKPMLVTLPCVLLLLDVWPLKRWLGEDGGRFARASPARLVLEKLPLFALVLGSVLLTWRAQQVSMNVEAFALNTRVANASVAYAMYLAKTFWPVNLACFYPHLGVQSAEGAAAGLRAGLLLAAITAVVLILARRRAFLPVGWFWFLGTLVPVIGLVQVGAQGMADRYAYLPLIGVYLIVVWGAYELIRRLPRLRAPLGLAGALVLAALGVGVRQQVPFWKNELTLFGRALDVTSDNFFAHHGLGYAYVRRGELDQAREQFEAVVALVPDMVEGHKGLGTVLMLQEDWRGARPRLEEALRLRPEQAEVHHSLALVLHELGDETGARVHREEAARLDPELDASIVRAGDARRREGDLEAAIEQYGLALALEPDSARAHFGLGLTLMRTGDVEGAVRHLERAIEIDPDFVEALVNLGEVNLVQRDMELARARLERAIELAPDTVAAHHNLALVHQARGEVEPAIASLRRALEIDPSVVPSAQALAWILAAHPESSVRDGEEAVRWAEVVAEATNHEQPFPLEVLAAAHAEAGDFGAAIRWQEEAIRLQGTQPRPQTRARLELYRAGRPFRYRAGG